MRVLLSTIHAVLYYKSRHIAIVPDCLFVIYRPIEA